MLRSTADIRNPNSLASQMRLRRFLLFRRLIEPLPRPLTILDLGGTAFFWQQMQFVGQPETHITILNLVADTSEMPGLTSLAGDARDLSQFQDHQFDVVFSNSTIEHVGTFADQQSMADEMRRVGKYYFVQTPNRYFPIEPHFLFPFFQFLPLALRVKLLQSFDIGHTGRVPDYQAALAAVSEIRLLTEGELRRLFPEASIYKERVGGLTKSLVAYYFGCSDLTDSE